MNRPKPYTGSENFIFASYSHADQEKVFETILEMQKRGYRVWFDAAIRPGHEWDDELALKIEECSCFVSFMSENYKKSENCKDELSYARDLEKTRVIILLEPVDLSRGGMAMRNKRVQQISKFSYGSNDAFFEDFSVANNVDTCVEKTALPVSLPAVPDTPATINVNSEETVAVSDFAEKVSAAKKTAMDTTVTGDTEKSSDKTISAADKSGEFDPEKENVGSVSQFETFLASQDRENGYAFISYSTEREEEAFFVRDLLRKHGVNVWIAPESIPTGKDYPEAIMEGIFDCSCFVLILTQQAVESRDVKAELHHAFANDKAILALEFDSAINKTFAYYLSNAQRERVVLNEPNGEGVQKFITAVIGYAGQSLCLPHEDEYIKADTDAQGTQDTETSTAKDASDLDGSAQTECAIRPDASIEEALAVFGDSIPANAFKDRADLTHVTLPSQITQIGKGAFSGCTGLITLRLPEGLKSIPEDAFRECTSLMSINIPDSVMHIGKNAFRNCSSLQKIFIPDSVKTIENRAFEFCSALTSVRLSGGIKELEEYTFDECKALTEITVPASVTVIGQYAFADCSSLASVTLSENLIEIGYGAFQSTALRQLQIPDTVKRIGNWAFQKCEQLKSVNLPESLKSTVSFVFPNVSSSAFNYRSATQDETVSAESTTGTLADQVRALLNGTPTTAETPSEPEEEPQTEDATPREATADILHIPAGTTVIEKDAYRNRTEITSVIFPEGLLEIGASAFAGCENLQSVHLPEGLHTIGRNAFKDCSALQSVHLPATLKVIDQWAFKECAALSEITLPDGLEQLEEMAFKGCESLSAIRIPKSLQNLSRSVFSSCTSLSKIELHENITVIGDYAFKDCAAVTSIDWPKNLTTIGKWAFKGCCALTSVRLPETVTTVGDYAFSGCTQLTELYLPQALTSAGNWAFKDCDALKTVTLSKQIRSERFRLFGNVADSVFITAEEQDNGEEVSVKSESDSLADRLRQLLSGTAENNAPKSKEEDATQAETVPADADPGMDAAEPVQAEPSPAVCAQAVAPPPPPQESIYYYVADGKNVGPYPQDMIEQFIRQNVILRNTFLWKSGMEKHEAASAFSEFSSLFAKLPPLPPV